MSDEMSGRRSTVAVVGAGHVGAAVANDLAVLGVCQRIVLCNRGRPRAEGIAYDIADATAVFGDVEVTGTSDWEAIAGADVAVVTVGHSIRVGKSRLEIAGNDQLIREVVARLDEVAPDAIVLMVSNPVDVLTRLGLDCSLRPWQRVFGAGTVLDSARLRRSLATLLGVDPQNTHLHVLGEHGDSSLIAWSAATIGPVPLASFPLPEGETLAELKERCLFRTRRRGGADIIARKGYTDDGIAAVVCRLVQAVFRDERRIFSVSTRALADYGLGEEVVLGLPCVIGRAGIVRRLPLALDADEKALLERSAAILNAAYEPLAGRSV
jgi:L-lactate dehydrogenase